MRSFLWGIYDSRSGAKYTGTAQARESNPNAEFKIVRRVGYSVKVIPPKKKPIAKKRRRTSSVW